MFKAVIGDLFESESPALLNAVNCVGVMGKGVALEFKKRFPAMYKDYVSRCGRKAVRLGEPYLFNDSSGTSIVNFPTKDHWRSPSRHQDVERGLDYLAAHVDEWGIKIIAMPALGCGNGGLRWSEVGPLIYRKLSALSVDVTVYPPYGTTKQELTEGFLSGLSR